MRSRTMRVLNVLSVILSVAVLCLMCVSIASKADAPAPATPTPSQLANPDNWHTVVYHNLEFTLYTGPGQIASTKLIQPVKLASE